MNSNIRRIEDNTIKVATTGNVDSGKTTLTGCLVNNILDNGKGSARSTVTKIKHELETGRTSQISFNYLKFGDDMKNPCTTTDRQKMSKIITMVDLAGHEKYLKTTMFGLTGLFVDYSLVIISAEDGIIGTTKEHLGILIHLKIPILVVITKIDRAPEHMYEKTLKQLKQIFKNKHIKKKPIFINKDTEKDKALDEINKYTEIMENTNTIIPIISVSNKTGQNLDLVNILLYNLKPRIMWNKNDIEGSIYYIDSTFNVKGIGLVLSGTVQGENIKTNDNMYLGPLKNGNFVPFKIRSLHNNIREDVQFIGDREAGCMAVRFTSKQTLNKKQINKGMIAISQAQYNKNVCMEFKAEITILQHSTTIETNYQPIIHCNNVRQSARIILDKDKILRVNDTAIVTFQYMFKPEFMVKGSKLFFRDGKTRGVGRVVEVIPIEKK
jgi:GTPase